MTSRFFVFSLCLIFCATDVSAQARSEDPRSSSQLHIGIFYLDPSIRLTEFGFDTNVFNSADVPEKDFTFTLTPGLTTALPIARRGLLRLDSAVDLVYFQEHKSERSINPQVALRGEMYTNRFTLFAEPSYLRTRQRPSFEIERRSLRVEQGTSVGVEAYLRPKLALEVNVRHLRTEFDDGETFQGVNLGAELNRISWTYGAIARWTATPLTTFFVKGESIRDRFILTHTRSSDSTRIVGGVDLKPRALISGRVEVGIRDFRTLNENVPNSIGLVALGSLSHTVRGATTFRVTVEREPNYSFDPLRPYYIQTSYGVSIRRQLVGRFDTTIGFDTHRHAYRNFTDGRPVAEIEAESRVDTRNAIMGDVGYRLGRTGRLGFGASYWTRKQDARGIAPYDGLRFGTSFTYGL